MHTFTKKPKADQQTTSAKTTIPAWASLGQSREVYSTLHLQRTIENQAVQRLLQSSSEGLQAESTTSPSARLSTRPAVAESGREAGPGDIRPGGGLGGAAATGAASSHSATLSVTGNTYVDTASESRNNARFNATWKGGSKGDYIIVNWLKGYMKNPLGIPYKVTMYGSSVGFNFSSWQVDSVDADPAYWSSGGTRWRYAVDAPNAFHATDSPGPMYTKDGKGAKAKVDFKTAVYKSSDVPTKTTGTISATPLTSFQPWNYHVEVLGGGKFKH